jgi:UDP-N-acetylglucosamine acyltransferase
MATQIHPSAIIEQGAELADGVQIGPYAYIGGRVKLGPDTVVAHHATVDGSTTVGEGNFVHPYAYIGGPTQDLKLKVVIPAYYRRPQQLPRICDGALWYDRGNSDANRKPQRIFGLCPYRHDCQVGSFNVMSNSVGLAGHITWATMLLLAGWPECTNSSESEIMR